VHEISQTYLADFVQHLLTLPSTALKIFMCRKCTVNVPYNHLLCRRFLIDKNTEKSESGKRKNKKIENPS